jgi:hypothetical protein
VCLTRWKKKEKKMMENRMSGLCAYKEHYTKERKRIEKKERIEMKRKKESIHSSLKRRKKNISLEFEQNCKNTY